MPTTTLPNATDHVISLQTAIDMTTRYRTNRETILNSNYKGENILLLSEISILYYYFITYFSINCNACGVKE